MLLLLAVGLVVALAVGVGLGYMLARGLDSSSPPTPPRAPPEPPTDTPDPLDSDPFGGLGEIPQPNPPVVPPPPANSCICTMEWAPVCASGKSYGNACTARCAGETAWSVGSCTGGGRVDTLFDRRGSGGWLPAV